MRATVEISTFTGVYSYIVGRKEESFWITVLKINPKRRDTSDCRP